MIRVEEEYWFFDRINQKTLPLDLIVDDCYYQGQNTHIYLIGTGVNNITPLYDAFDSNGVDLDDHTTFVYNILKNPILDLKSTIHNIKIIQGGKIKNIQNAVDVILTHHNQVDEPGVVLIPWCFAYNEEINYHIQRLENAGLLPICSAGNYNQHTSAFSPCSLETCLVVASSDRRDSSVGKSDDFLNGLDKNNFGEIDLYAPGFAIKSKNNTGKILIRNGSGYAASLTAAVACKLLQKSPELSTLNLKNSILKKTTQGVLRNFELSGPNYLLFDPTVKEYLIWKDNVDLGYVESNKQYEHSLDLRIQLLNGDLMPYSIEFGSQIVPHLKVNYQSIYGFLEQQIAATDYNFDLQVQTFCNQYVRNYKINVLSKNQKPVWIEPAGLLDFGTIVVSGSNYAKTLRFEDDSLTKLTLHNGILPKSMNLDNNGLLKGQVDYGLNFGTKTFEFVSRLKDELWVNDRYFTIDVFSENKKPSWITPQGVLANLKRGQFLFFNLQARDLNQDLVVYEVIGGNLPQGLILNTSGLLKGVVGDNPDGSYKFVVRSRDPYSFILGNFEITIQGDSSTALPLSSIEWITDSLPILYAGDQCYIDLQAQSKNHQEIKYQLLEDYGNLPPGLKLFDSQGYIYGTVEEIGYNAEYSFTIRAYTQDQFLDKRFLLKIQSRFAKTPYHVYYQLDKTLSNKFDDIYDNNNVINYDWLYRKQIQNFDYQAYVCGISENTTLDDIYLLIKSYYQSCFYKNDFVLGSIKTQPIYYNSKYIYDLLYRPIYDPQLGASTSDQGVLYSKIFGVYNKNIYQNIRPIERIYPNSIQNIKNRLIQTFENHSIYPLGQTSASFLLPCAKVLPGKGNILINDYYFLQKNKELDQMTITIDRFVVDRIIEKNYIKLNENADIQ